MDKKAFLKCTMLFCLVLFSSIPALCSIDGMGTFNVDIEISTTSLHEWMPSVTYNPIENEFLVLWHTTGVREEGGESMYSLHAQRISPDGTLLEEAFSPLTSVGPGRRLLPKAAQRPDLQPARLVPLPTCCCEWRSIWACDRLPACHLQR